MLIPVAHDQCLHPHLQDGAQRSWCRLLLAVCVQHSDRAMLVQSSAATISNYLYLLMWLRRLPFCADYVLKLRALPTYHYSAMMQ